MSARQSTRCAIYTRKSTESGLDMRVTSLVAQRDVCQSYIKCQAHRDWIELPKHYDDGGVSGGTLQRPALGELIADVEAGRVDVIVIYKLDRLTRSLLDFVRLMDVLSRYGATFACVTQNFDTSDSMGRLILNVLLTFAQFEREIMSDRVRDKKAAMMRKGLFTGGLPPFGYLNEDGGRLVIDPERGPLVREFFARYPEVGSVRELVNDMRDRGCVTRQYVSRNGREHGGHPITTAVFRQILKNPVYTGFIVHRGEWIKGEFEPLITREQWDLVQEERLKRRAVRDPVRDFLIGILHDEHGRRMKILTEGRGRTNGRRYYRSEHSGWSRHTEFKNVLVNAGRIEDLAKSALQAFLADRAELRAAVMSMGRYSEEIGRLLRKGSVAARRVAVMDPTHIRQLFLAIVLRAEATSTELRMFVSCSELVRLLQWNGIGVFRPEGLAHGAEPQKVHLITAPASLAAGHPIFSLPIRPCLAHIPVKKNELVRLLDHGTELKAYVHANRDKTVRELAKEKKLSESLFGRLLRLNYLAPDIQTAIIDGTQPPSITRRDLLYGPMPMDWSQQRQLLGFGSSVP